MTQEVSDAKPSPERERIIIEASVLAATLLLIVVQVGPSKNGLFKYSVFGTALLFIIAAVATVVSMWPDVMPLSTHARFLSGAAELTFFITGLLSTAAVLIFLLTPEELVSGTPPFPLFLWLIYIAIDLGTLVFYVFRPNHPKKQPEAPIAQPR